MASMWNRLPSWADWIVALVAAMVVLNLNVTDAGDPLSGVGLSGGPSSPGITEGARATFYGVLVIGALLLTVAGIVLSAINRPDRLTGRLLVRTYPWLALAGLLGLLLDYRDGPVRTVQLVVYLMMFLGIIRLARIVSLASSSPTAVASRGHDDAHDAVSTSS